MTEPASTAGPTHHHCYASFVSALDRTTALGLTPVGLTPWRRAEDDTSAQPPWLSPCTTLPVISSYMRKTCAEVCTGRTPEDLVREFEPSPNRSATGSSRRIAAAAAAMTA